MDILYSNYVRLTSVTNHKNCHFLSTKQNDPMTVDGRQLVYNVSIIHPTCMANLYCQLPWKAIKRKLTWEATSFIRLVLYPT